MNYELNKNIPQVRFPEFNDDWSERRLSEFLTRYSEHNKDEEFSIDEILSLSSTLGIVDRKKLLGNTYDKVNHKNYIKTRLNDFVYGKSISANYPYGLFKVNNCKDGLLSTLYFTFKVHNNTIPTFLDIYFSYHNRANNFLKKYVLVGGRYITADANYILSGKIFTPTLPEQKRIANFFTILDNKINQLKEKKALLEEYKKGMMQKIFSQEIRFKDDDGEEFPEWEVKKLGEEATFFSGGTPTSTRKEYYNGNIPFIKSGEINAVKTEQYLSESGLKNSSAKLVNVGDLLYALYGATSGEVGISKINGAINQAILCIRTATYNKLFLVNYLIHSKQIIIGTYLQGGQGNLSAEIVKSLKIPTPIIKEQTKIANFLSKIDNKIKTVNEQIEETKEYKKGLLQKMYCV